MYRYMSMSNYAAKLSGEVCGASCADSAATDLDGQATAISAAFGVWRVPSGRTSKFKKPASELSSERETASTRIGSANPSTHKYTHARAESGFCNKTAH